MATDNPNPSAASPGPDLPPVQPPSGRFIAQLFFVPGMIVVVLVLLVLAINYLFVGGNTSDQLLARIDSPTADIRWRGANDLAQILKRKESLHLRTDVDFALGIVERLSSALDSLRQQEKRLAVDLKGREETGKSFRTLEAQRNQVGFLMAALGDFPFAVGVPLLADVATRDESADLLNETMRRRQAVWALANLGQSSKAYDAELKPEHRNLILAKLRRELDPEAVAERRTSLASKGVAAEAIASREEARRKAAKNALRLLGEFPVGDPELIAVDQTLAKVAEAKDQFLRSQAALAFNFWDGPAAEPTLQKLARDSGFGTLIRDPDEP